MLTFAQPKARKIFGCDLKDYTHDRVMILALGVRFYKMGQEQKLPLPACLLKSVQAADES